MIGSAMMNQVPGAGAICLYQSIIQCGDCFRLKLPMRFEQKIRKFIICNKPYNRERPHESLNNLTPEEYRLLAENNEISKSVWN